MGELGMLPPVGNPNSGAGERLAAYLADASKAWKVATPEERNRFARPVRVSDGGKQTSRGLCATAGT